MKTCEEVRESQTAFRRPVRDSLTELTLEERLLRGKLLLEEVIEHLTKGLGLQFETPDGIIIGSDRLTLGESEIYDYDPIETADGLGDINVVIHGTALEMGIDLDAVTTEIHRSNMSKMGEDGQPIINGCRHWESNPGAHDGEETRAHCLNQLMGAASCEEQGHSIDPSQPIGKILKGPNYFKPDIAKVIGY